MEKAFQTWTANGVRFIAFVLHGTGGNTVVMDDDGNNYGSWRSADAFRRAHESNTRPGRRKIVHPPTTPLGKMRLSGVIVSTIALVLSFPDVLFAAPEALLDAIRQVESGGRVDAVGDNGKAIGPYQIHRGYWDDATKFGGVDWPHTDATNEAKARQVVRWYWQRYAPAGASDETLARIHNGGPRGHLKDSTVGYWRRVQRALGRERP